MLNARLPAITGALLLASCFSSHTYVLPVAAGRTAPELFEPLVACAEQRGLRTQRGSEEVQVHFPDSLVITYRMDGERNISMVVGRHVSNTYEAAMQMNGTPRQRGDELYDCAQTMAAQTPAVPARAPQGAPVQTVNNGYPQQEPQGRVDGTMPPETRGPQCNHLATCYVDLVHALCSEDNTHCKHANAFQLRTGMNEQACKQTIVNLPMAIEPIRQHKPDFEMPHSCFAEAP